MNNSYPHFEYSFQSSLSGSAKLVFMIVAYGFSAMCLLFLYLLLKDGECSAILNLLPFIFAAIFLQSLLRAKICYIAEPNQLKWHYRFWGIPFARKEKSIALIRHLCLRKTANANQSFRPSGKNEKTVSYVINVADDKGERTMVSALAHRCMQELFAFLQQHYPQLNLINQLDESEALRLEEVEWRSMSKFLGGFLSMASLVIALGVWTAGSILKDDYALYVGSNAYESWVPVERTIDSQTRRHDGDDTYYDVRFAYSYEDQHCMMSERFNRDSALCEGDYEPLIFCDPKKPQRHVVTKQNLATLALRVLELLVSILAIGLLLAVWLRWRKTKPKQCLHGAASSQH